MPISVHVYPTMPSRPCRFCLSLQDGSVFADFDVDDAGCAFLRRISFDGYGCCDGEFKKMNPNASRVLLSAIERGVPNSSKLEALLRAYFQENAGKIWPDALRAHDLM